ncbi:MAG: Sir2 family NAD-dependent protein deacetylase [Bacillota bacterium]|nr:Sir2 family NAD-dependent protein deacetylase [Bacillota bacterium]
MVQMDEKVKTVVDLLEQSDYTVAFTGPGIYAESDLPREDLPEESLWKMVDPEEFTINRYKQDPESFYEEGAPYFSVLYQLEPNNVHRVLTELEKRGLLKAVITQNIDGLHRKAGSKKVLKLHGTIRSATCTHCERKINIEDIIGDQDIDDISFPLLCPGCGKPLKPDVVLPGEPLPPAYYKARDEARQAELMIVIGPEQRLEQDLELPGECKNIVVIASEPTPFDKGARVVINEEPGKVMKLLLKELDQKK